MNLEWWAKKWEWTVYSRESSLVIFVWKVILSAVSLFYGTVVWCRNKGYDFGILSVRNVAIPVISIGNLSMGGSGKTALAIWCAEKILKNGKKVALLSRGYKRKGSENNIRIVSDGKEILKNADFSGDEPYLMAQKLKDAAIVAGADRYKSAKMICSRFRPDCIILDDGFQHRRLYRDFNIVSLDDSILKAPHIFPRGVLRENADALKRADFILIKSENGSYLDSFQKTFSISIKKPVAVFKYRFSELREHSTGKTVALKELSGKKVVSCSAIAHPEYFETLLKKEGAEIVVSKRYPDHHILSRDELKEIRVEADKRNALIVTTEKDAVKIPSDFPAMIAAVQIEWIYGGEEFEKALEKTVMSCA